MSEFVMASEYPESDSLGKLQTPDQLALLDAIDKLRSQNLGAYDISLPQLIVCGDQSSGKSSVLEGLTRLPFPIGEDTCTTFATELILRKSTNTIISCSITPSEERTKLEIAELRKFKHNYASLESFDFRELVRNAKEAMSIGAPTEFHDDTLQIRYIGPDLPSLTIVDLPGIIHADNPNQRAQKVTHKEQVKNLIRKYMKQEKSIILAVINAGYDWRLHKIFDFVKVENADARTLGIITKPDKVDQGSKSEQTFLQLAQNQIHHCQLGWHVVKNRGYDQQMFTDAQRDQDEEDFFASGVWNQLPPDDLGIVALKEKLSTVLLRHVCKELPSLIDDIRAALEETSINLKELGIPRQTDQELQVYLLGIAGKFQMLTKDALEGNYSNTEFFAPSLPPNKSANRLRTEIQNLNIAFAQVMYQKGHMWEINDNEDRRRNHPVLADEATQYSTIIDDPTPINRRQFLEIEISPRVRQSRQAGLVSLVNPHVIGEIFREQSKRWSFIAVNHIERVFRAAKDYVDLGLGSLTDGRTFQMLMAEHIIPELEERRERLKSKLEEVLLPYRKQVPITYDPAFGTEIEDIRARRYDAQISGSSGLKRSWPQLLTESLDDFTASEILDLTQTYYKRAISVFITNVTVLAIESCMLTDLGTIFPPTLVLTMEREQLLAIASESKEIRDQRASLKQKLDDLKAGKRILDKQAHKADSVYRRSAQGKRSAPPIIHTAPQVPRPKTPEQEEIRTGSDEEVDDLTSSIERMNITPPPNYSQTRRRPRTSATRSSPTPTNSTHAQARAALFTSEAWPAGNGM
ncbi:P-loop containing nucleoside triphosphate hydrolase protein [Lophiotrema nucula]|uniref:P-loop containing nucleoside triphosphate hydrolase protein n=1 Tax=Lophiotrema nucula TaxID=690887 RepID=A0A6A5ZGQ4_9PLEO|nr:P-loop containing nucleoside triphosphate hydrolase protein [Lophiotrema nucula]